MGKKSKKLENVIETRERFKEDLRRINEILENTIEQSDKYLKNHSSAEAAVWLSEIETLESMKVDYESYIRSFNKVLDLFGENGEFESSAYKIIAEKIQETNAKTNKDLLDIFMKLGSDAVLVFVEYLNKIMNLNQQEKRETDIEDIKDSEINMSKLFTVLNRYDENWAPIEMF
jgi:hypothetical protein